MKLQEAKRNHLPALKHPKGILRVIIFAEALSLALFAPVFTEKSYVKMGVFCLTRHVNIGYNYSMVIGSISFILRITIIVAIWILIWRSIEPRTQSARILRAALLLLSLLTVLAVIRIAGVTTG
jgi:lipoprotein signal peptidase